MRQHYRTTPPPKGATQAELVAWAVKEGAQYPGTPMFYYTWWLKRVKQSTRRRPPQQLELGL